MFTKIKFTHTTSLSGLKTLLMASAPHSKETAPQCQGSVFQYKLTYTQLFVYMPKMQWHVRNLSSSFFPSRIGMCTSPHSESSQCTVMTNPYLHFPYLFIPMSFTVHNTQQSTFYPVKSTGLSHAQCKKTNNSNNTILGTTCRSMQISAHTNQI